MERKIVLKKDLLDTFKAIGAFEASCPVAKAALGNETVTLMRQRQLMDFEVRWIEENRK